MAGAKSNRSLYVLSGSEQTSLGDWGHHMIIYFLNLRLLSLFDAPKLPKPAAFASAHGLRSGSDGAGDHA